MKVLVTGTAGFIGMYVSKKILEEGNEVIGLDCINDYYNVNLKYGRLSELGIDKSGIEYNKLIKSTKYSKLSFIKLNLEDRENIQNLFKNNKIDIVCNLAAQAGVRYSIKNPYAYIDSNIVGFLNILEGCRNNDIKTLIYASSSSVYGMNNKVPFSEQDRVDNPVSLYAATKRSNELMAHTYSHLYDISTLGLRFFTVYGPWGRPDMAPFIFTKAIIKGEKIKIFNNGDMMRDFTFIDDITASVVKLINKEYSENQDIINKSDKKLKTKSDIFNIGNSQPIKLMDFIHELEKSIGKEALKEYLPMQPGDVYQTNANTEKLENYINFKPSTSLTKGISEFVEWFMNNEKCL